MLFQAILIIGFDKSFVLWMDIRAEIREVVFQGMKNFEWK